MNAVSMNNLWTYLQGLSLTASNRKWLAERLLDGLKQGNVKTRSAEELLYEL